MKVSHRHCSTRNPAVMTSAAPRPFGERYPGEASPRHRQPVLLSKRMWTFFALSAHCSAWLLPREKPARVRERSARHRLSRLQVILQAHFTAFRLVRHAVCASAGRDIAHARPPESLGLERGPLVPHPAAAALQPSGNSIPSAVSGNTEIQSVSSTSLPILAAFSHSHWKPLEAIQMGEDRMRHRIGILLLSSAAMIVPAAAQQGQPNPNQVAAKAILQAADKAIGASSVNSYIASSTGWRGYPGQQFSEGDLPRSDMKSNVRTVDFTTKSAKTDYVRVQGNNIPRGGGAGFPVQGEPRFIEVVNGNTAWNVNAQGQPVRILATDAGDRQLSNWTNPIGFIKAGLAAPNAAATDRYFGRENRTVKVVAFTVKVCDGPQPQCTRRVTGEFNNDNMLERVITWYPDPVLGDKMVEYRWSDYRDVGNGVKFPFHVHAHMGDHPLIPGGHNWLDLRTNDVKINVADARVGRRAQRPAPTQARGLDNSRSALCSMPAVRITASLADLSRSSRAAGNQRTSAWSPKCTNSSPADPLSRQHPQPLDHLACAASWRKRDRHHRRHQQELP